MLWDPEDIDGSTHTNMMSSFKHYVNETNYVEEGEEADQFCIQINNHVQFSLAMEYIQAGLSFRQAAYVMKGTKERTDLAAIGSCSDCTIAKYTWYICAICLQKISELIKLAWTFSIALDMSTHMSTSYLDIRVRLHLNHTGIINLHLLALPAFDKHTGLVMFEIASKALDTLCTEWRDIIIGISTDGERKMTGHISGVATRFQEVAKPGFIRIWCGAHHFFTISLNCKT